MSHTLSPSPPHTPSTSHTISIRRDSDCGESANSRKHQFNTSQDAVSTPSHPFAASTKANRAPPSYEKKPFTPPTTPPHPKKHFLLCREQTRISDVKAEVAPPSIRRSPSLTDDEQKRWDTAISSAIDKAETTLDLSNAGLTYIPSSIIDLKALVVLARNERRTTSTPISTTSPRAFVRSTTTPALLPSSRVRPFLPSRTMNGLTFRAAGNQRDNLPQTLTDRNRCEVQLFLMRNAIRMLPRELFALDCLVVLSLRQNKLTSLPPAICKLTRLRELNVANNRLCYLPAEIQELHLASLHLYPNPFITPPLPPEVQQTHGMNSDTAARTLGPLKHGPSVPTLSELALRRLLSPAIPASHTPPTTRSETCLEAAMTLAEIDALHLPLHMKHVVRASTGHGRARVSEEGACMNAELDMSRNVCPCPRHRPQAESEIGVTKSVRFVQTARPITFDYNGPVFAVPVEERMEWVGMVGGVHVAENPGAWVPLLWRGCGHGCLDFLEDKEDAGANDMYEHTFESGKGVEEFKFSDDEEDTV